MAIKKEKSLYELACEKDPHYKEFKKGKKFLDLLVSGKDIIYLESEGKSREVLFIGAPMIPDPPNLPYLPIICFDLNSEDFYVADKYEIVPEKRKVILYSPFTKKAFNDPEVDDSWRKKMREYQNVQKNKKDLSKKLKNGN